MAIIVDASVVARALIPSQRIEAAEALLSADELLAPTLLKGEFYNAVLAVERRRLHEPDTSDRALVRFESLGITLLEGPHWASRAFEIARRYQTSVFDAIYLACAEDLDAELWTCDARFVRAFGPDRPGRLKLCPDDVLRAGDAP